MREGSPASDGVWSTAVDPQRRLVTCRCPGCGYASGRLAAPAALRDAAVAHLAEHVLRERFPPHLRTCSCRTAGCGWHPGRRACGGRIVLILFRSPSEGAWHLADVCETCADSIPQAVRIPSVPDLSPAPTADRTRKRRRGGEASTAAGQQLVARAALACLAALPTQVGAEARLLAAVCALRTRRTGIAPLPPGLIRSLRLAQPVRALGELQETGWLYLLGRSYGRPAVFTPDLAAHRRGRAGQWALRLLADPRVACLDPAARLAVLTVLAWAEEPGETFLVEPEGAANTSGLSPQAFTAALARARSTGALGPYVALPSGLLCCTAPSPRPMPNDLRRSQA